MKLRLLLCIKILFVLLACTNSLNKKNLDMECEIDKDCPVDKQCRSKQGGGTECRNKIHKNNYYLEEKYESIIEDKKLDKVDEKKEVKKESSGGIYRYVSPDGKVYYTDRPSHKSYKRVIRSSPSSNNWADKPKEKTIRHKPKSNEMSKMKEKTPSVSEEDKINLPNEIKEKKEVKKPKTAFDL